MPSKNRTASQARKDRAALKRLQKSGTYKGKIDLRKAPTDYQLKKIKALRGSKPKLPPKQKVKGARIKRRVISEKEVRKIKAEGGFTLKTYALPFLRKGQIEPEWRRFTRAQLTKFLNEYKGADSEGAAEWRSYAVEETWTFDSRSEKSDFRKSTDLYFSGVRISEPRASQAELAKSRSRLSTKGRKRGRSRKRGS